MPLLLSIYYLGITVVGLYLSVDSWFPVSSAILLCLATAVPAILAVFKSQRSSALRSLRAYAITVIVLVSVAFTSWPLKCTFLVSRGSLLAAVAAPEPRASASYPR